VVKYFFQIFSGGLLFVSAPTPTSTLAKDKPRTGFRIDEELLRQFKSRLAADGVSMNAAIECWIHAYVEGVLRILHTTDSVQEKKEYQLVLKNTSKQSTLPDTHQPGSSQQLFNHLSNVRNVARQMVEELEAALSVENSTTQGPDTQDASQTDPISESRRLINEAGRFADSARRLGVRPSRPGEDMEGHHASDSGRREADSGNAETGKRKKR
jgi:hypothetical protein